MKKGTVLIIDDHTLFRDIWSMMLEESDKYSVIGNTGDGHMAIEIAREKRPDLVLLDINMQPINGFDILKMIRKYSPASKVIAVSMHTQASYVKKMLRGGAKGYVTKNSPGEELLLAIENVMNSKVYICKQARDLLTDIETDNGNLGIDKLTEREMEVIGHIRSGLSSKEIAGKMNIEPKTVEVHRHNILKKLEVKNAASLITLMNERGL